MPIVQVSRITQRKGLEEDLPQPLASAELGWAIDQRRLYIGNGSLAEGAPVVGNTEVLTEFSDILAYTTAYTYEGAAAGYTVQTGITSGTPVTQSLQQRLDSFAIITEFGATGNGVTDDTAAINRALFQLYCRQSNPQIRRSLFFPAGVYVVTDTILLPPYAKLYGEGANSSIIKFTVQPWVSGVAYAQGVLVKTEDPVTSVVSYYRSKVAVPPELDGLPIPLTNTVYWDSTSLPNYMIENCDSLQQTAPNIGANGATPPRNVEINSMAFETTEYGNDSSLGHNIMLIDQLQQATFQNVNFTGALTTAELTAAIENLAAIRFASGSSRPCSDITFDACRFQGLTYAFNTDNLVKGITVSNSWFNTLYQGIVLGDNAPNDGGPTGFRIMHNLFDNIASAGIVFENAGLNASGYNTFYDVANNFNGNNFPAGPVITINADNNISVGDLFQRTTAQTQLGVGYPRIQLWNTAVVSGQQVGFPTTVVLNGSDGLQMGSYSRLTGQQQPILDGQTETLFAIETGWSLQNGGYKTFRMDYTIYRQAAAGRALRTGTLTVVAGDSGDSSTEGLVYIDDYTENEQTDVSLVVTEDSDNTVTVQYTAEPTTFDGTIFYSIEHLA